MQLFCDKTHKTHPLVISVRALDEKLLAGVGLDVTTPEPLPTNSALLKHDNCVILPHIGKRQKFMNVQALIYCVTGSATIEAREVMGEMCIDNVLAGIQGKQLPFALKH